MFRARGSGAEQAMPGMANLPAPGAGNPIVFQMTLLLVFGAHGATEQMI